MKPLLQNVAFGVPELGAAAAFQSRSELHRDHSRRMERPSKCVTSVSTSTVCVQRVTQRLPGVVGAVKHCYHPPHGPVSSRL